MLASGLEQFTWAWGGDDSHLSHRLAMDCGNRYVFESCQSLIPKSVLTSRLEKFTCAFPPDCGSRYVFERCQSLTPNSALTSRLEKWARLAARCCYSGGVSGGFDLFTHPLYYNLFVVCIHIHTFLNTYTDLSIYLSIYTHICIYIYSYNIYLCIYV